MRCPGDCEFCTIDSLRAELAGLRASRRWEYIEALEDRAGKSEAALVRVRELWTSHGLAVPPEILRALDGAE